MTIEEAITTALAYEIRVRDRFAELATQSREPGARGFFELMTGEEQGHVEYLEAKLAQWQQTGELSGAELATAVPRRDWVRRGTRVLDAAVAAPADHGSPLDHLSAALRLEEEVSAFYRELVGSVEHPQAAALFRRFLEIEDGHTALVRAQIDHETHTGHFFDLQEFTLDG